MAAMFAFAHLLAARTRRSSPQTTETAAAVGCATGVVVAFRPAAIRGRRAFDRPAGRMSASTATHGVDAVQHGDPR